MSVLKMCAVCLYSRCATSDLPWSNFSLEEFRDLAVTNVGNGNLIVCSQISLQVARQLAVIQSHIIVLQGSLLKKVRLYLYFCI